MKYVFGVAFVVLAYAVYGVVSSPHDRAAVIPSASAVAANPAHPAPAAFKIIRVVGGSSPSLADSHGEPLSGDAAIDLTTEIQQRLASANCYDGPMDGVWSDVTRDAAQRFISSARAEVSAAQPNDGLLALLRSRGDDKSLCSSAGQRDDQANAGFPAPIQSADATTSFEQPMGLGGPGSPSSYTPRRGGDKIFRHPLGGF